MWCVPHPKKPKHTLVLLDTEGLGDVEKVINKNFFLINLLIPEHSLHGEFFLLLLDQGILFSPFGF